MRRPPLSRRNPPVVNRESWLEPAQSALRLLQSMREGGRWERAIAAASLVTVARTWARGEVDHLATLRSRGLEPAAFSLHRFWVELLQGCGSPAQVGEWKGDRVVHWEALGVAVHFSRDQIEDIWMRAGAEPVIAAAIAPQVWNRSRHVQILAETSRRIDVEVDMKPLPPPGDLVGDQGLDAIVSHLKDRRDGRTLLVRGPSGVGKSTVARRLADRLVGPAGRLLQIPASSIDAVQSLAIRDFAVLLRPDVLVIDDVPSRSKGSSYSRDSSSRGRRISWSCSRR